MEVGFDDARQADTVGGLSGGWKMKLELARAMLYNADLLLLDEVRNLFSTHRYMQLTLFTHSSLRITYVSDYVLLVVYHSSKLSSWTATL